MRIVIVFLMSCFLVLAACDGGGGGGSDYHVTFNVAGGAQGVVYDKGFTDGGNVPVVMFTSTSSLVALDTGTDFSNYLSESVGGLFASLDDFVQIAFDGIAAGTFSVDTSSTYVKMSGTKYTVTTSSVVVTSFGTAVEGSFTLTLDDGNNTVVQGTFKALALDLTGGGG